MKMKATLDVTSRKKWKAWLEAHHSSATEVWLIIHKKRTGKPSMEYEDAVQEALCYGWIDSLIQRIDDDAYARKFTPRKPGSKWSKPNRDRVASLLKEGRMTRAGLATLEFLHADRPRLQPVVVDDAATRWFANSLRTHSKAFRNYENLAPSYRRLYLRWVMDAKKEETRDRRLREAIALLEQNKRLGQK